jgi:hypothetical protein
VNRHLASLGLLVSLLSACSYDLRDHPSSCQSATDCAQGEQCFEQLCIAESGLANGGTGATSGVGGAQAGFGGSGGGGNGATGGSAASPVGGSQGGDGDPVGDASSGDLLDASDDGDAAALDAALDSGPTVAPYASCADDEGCNPGETCKISAARGFCAAPCAMSTDCSLPSGTFNAAPTCNAQALCRLDCGPSPPVPPFDRSCPTGMVCAADSGALTRSCYPN